ncbi:HBR138Cp [Eremothecium sinecaudum]|uniref:HBR138Cp n=1 Tax=Eremothecium sinecaudum TaxID=45286 RepID=A0A120K155_9SACH|nr:HBR138Cp [Eremothecium sinecaudum]AMD19039.1 HBR138Cp [Eremothecium sinecaudum]
MELYLTNNEPSRDLWLWQPTVRDPDDVNDFPETLTLLFGVYYLDKFATSVGNEVEKLLDKLNDIFLPWNDYYPWEGYNGVQLKRFIDKSGLPFIFGELVVGDNFEEEESLVLGILKRFSMSAGSNVFIKMCDTQGDFILMSCSEIIPAEYEYPVGNNRLWLNEGQFSFIPVSIEPGRGLSQEKSLEFLRSSYYKCIKMPEITNYFEENLINDFPTSHLKGLRWLSFRVSLDHLKILHRNKKLSSILLKNFVNEDIDAKTIANRITDDAKQLKLLATENHCRLLSHYLASNPELEEYDKETLIGAILSSSLEALTNNKTLLSRDCDRCLDSTLVDSLTAMNQLTKNINIPDAVISTESCYLEQEAAAKKFESDLQSLLSSIKKEADETSQAPSMRNEPDDDADDDDKAAREYFNSQGLDISEDDFFEYFLTEALNMKEEDLDDYKNRNQNELMEDLQDTKEEVEMLEEFEAILGSNNRADCNLESLEHLLRSMRVDGSAYAVESMLKNLNATRNM